MRFLRTILRAHNSRRRVLASVPLRLGDKRDEMSPGREKESSGASVSIVQDDVRPKGGDYRWIISFRADNSRTLHSSTKVSGCQVAREQEV